MENLEVTKNELDMYLASIEVDIEGISVAIKEKVLSDMVSEQADLKNPQKWKSRINQEEEIKARVDLRSLKINPLTGGTGGDGTGDPPDSFIQQIYYVLRMSDLRIRDWNMIVNTVLFYDSAENLTKINRMVYASRYIGFDPSVILRKLIRYHREGMRRPSQTFLI